MAKFTTSDDFFAAFDTAPAPAPQSQPAPTTTTTNGSNYDFANDDFFTQMDNSTSTSNNNQQQQQQQQQPRQQKQQQQSKQSSQQFPQQKQCGSSLMLSTSSELNKSNDSSSKRFISPVEDLDPTNYKSDTSDIEAILSGASTAADGQRTMENGRGVVEGKLLSRVSTRSLLVKDWKFYYFQLDLRNGSLSIYRSQQDMNQGVNFR